LPVAAAGPLSGPLHLRRSKLANWPLALEDGGNRLTYTFANAEGGGIPALLRRLGEIGVDFTDLETSTSTLEDIFVGLIGRAA